MLYEIKVGTVTRAQRSVYILKKNGISSAIGRIRNPQKTDGCGYTVRVRTTSIESVLSLLEQNGVECYGAVAL